ncbi:hypothetical protein RIF29_27504 [Crotalaria pallida]|uniref:FAF domain-containing protein n=1 Tax=Crotalaria pallida TaxID=3830 RepID=A0AAN9EQ49_CROPI
MATCGSLQHIFDNLLPENPTPLESLPWNQIKNIKSIEKSPSFTEIFGELHFNENPLSSTSYVSSSKVPTSSSSSIGTINHWKIEDSESSYASQTPITNHTNNRHKSRDSFSSLSSESLQLCTEGLGFESSVEVEGLESGSGMSECWNTRTEAEEAKKNITSEGKCRRSRAVSKGGYPPPISCIGRVWFRSYRSNGRFVLKEIRIPTQEFLHAYRENGRLKLQLVQPHDDEFLQEESDQDDDDYGEDEVDIVDEEEGNMGKENEVDGIATDQITNLLQKETANLETLEGKSTAMGNCIE